MESPLNRFRPELELVLSTIPSDHIISKSEILAFPPDLIRAIQFVSHYIFGPSLDINHYACIEETVLTCVGNMIDSFPDGTIILAPGDSPLKIVKIMEFLYYNPETQKWEYESNGQRIQKQLQFVSFPLSGTPLWPIDELDAYVNSFLDPILNSENSIPNIVYFDYIEEGKSMKAVNGVLRRRLNNPEFTMLALSLERTCFEFEEKECSDMDVNQFLVEFFSDAEEEACRCIPPYSYLDHREGPPIPINLQRCNLTLILLYLRAIGRLLPLPDLPRFDFEKFQSNLIPNHYYTVTYYDVETGKIDTDLARYGDWRNYNFERIRPDGIEFPRIKSAHILTIAPSDIDLGISNWHPNPEDINKIGIATLINGQKIVSRLRENIIRPPPPDWINQTGFPAGKDEIGFENVIDFVPLN